MAPMPGEMPGNYDKAREALTEVAEYVDERGLIEVWDDDDRDSRRAIDKYADWLTDTKPADVLAAFKEAKGVEGT